MISISIIGSGNVALHLIDAVLNSNQLQINQVFTRKENPLLAKHKNLNIIYNIAQLQAVDLIIIAVSDDAIAIVSKEIKLKNQLIAHTSGSIAIDAIDDCHKKAVFYPLQTFSKNRTLNFNEVPICLEAQNEDDYKLIEKIGLLLSKKIFKINSLQRKNIHLSAVFVNNFTNHLYKIANDFANENLFSFEILLPLINETASKVNYILPKDAQTGPAKRNDKTVINNQLEMINNINYKEIYQTITNSILKNG